MNFARRARDCLGTISGPAVPSCVSLSTNEADFGGKEASLLRIQLEGLLVETSGSKVRLELCGKSANLKFLALRIFSIPFPLKDYFHAAVSDPISLSLAPALPHSVSAYAQFGGSRAGIEGESQV